ncbi:S1 family peptidase [Streptomyces sp. NPDC003691]
MGSENRTSGGTVRTISHVVTHPGYSADPGSNDIALVRLDRPVTHQPVRIAHRPGPVGTLTRAIGWGTVSETEDIYPERLQQLGLRTVPPGDCTLIDPASELCQLGRVPGTMACGGDSGGPLLKHTGKRWELIGATSRDGNRDGICTNAPGIWTDVTAHRNWIDKFLDRTPTGDGVRNTEGDRR